MKKKILIVLGILILLSIISIIVVYISNENIRNWIDTNILKKNLTEEDLISIDIENENTKVYAYDEYIVVLYDNKLIIYNKNGKIENTITVSITTPIFESSEKYLIVADKEGTNIYLIYNTTLQWHKTMEGSISKATVNKNGAVGIVITGTTYKSVIVMYGITGNEEFKTYLSSTIAMDVAISENQEYLSFAEANTSGTIINSTIKTISVNKAKTDPENAIVYKYEPEKNNLIVNIQFDKNNIICQYDDSVYSLKQGQAEKIIDIDSKTSFVDINLLGNICKIQELENGIINSEYELKIIDASNKKEKIYLVESTPKNVYCSEKLIVLNMGNKIEVVNNTGWLLKNFISKQSYKNIVVGNNILGIVYKDRVEIIKI